MLPIDTFTPPTDSLYKFLALTGIIIFLATGAFAWVAFKSFSERLYQAKKRGRLIARKLELMQSWIADVAHPQANLIKTRDETIEIACLSEENEVEVEELERVSRSLTAMLVISSIVMIASTVLAAKGFSLWYDRVQVYQDQLLRSEAEEKRKTEPNQSLQTTTRSSPTSTIFSRCDSSQYSVRVASDLKRSAKMKNSALLSFFAVMFLGGCTSRPVDQKPAKADQAVVIDFQAYFDKSHVILYVNDKKEFDGILTSIPVLSFTDQSVSVSSLEEKVKLRIIRDDFEDTEFLHLRNGRFIGIQFNATTKKFQFMQSENRFMYD